MYNTTLFTSQSTRHKKHASSFSIKLNRPSLSQKHSNNVNNVKKLSLFKNQKTSFRREAPKKSYLTEISTNNLNSKKPSKSYQRKCFPLTMKNQEKRSQANKPKKYSGLEINTDLDSSGFHRRQAKNRVGLSGSFAPGTGGITYTCTPINNTQGVYMNVEFTKGKDMFGIRASQLMDSIKIHKKNIQTNNVTIDQYDNNTNANPENEEIEKNDNFKSSEILESFEDRDHIEEIKKKRQQFKKLKVSVQFEPQEETLNRGVRKNMRGRKSILKRTKSLFSKKVTIKEQENKQHVVSKWIGREDQSSCQSSERGSINSLVSQNEKRVVIKARSPLKEETEKSYYGLFETRRFTELTTKRIVRNNNNGRERISEENRSSLIRRVKLDDFNHFERKN